MTALSTPARFELDRDDVVTTALQALHAAAGQPEATVVLAGLPGTGRGAVADRVCRRWPGPVHDAAGRPVTRFGGRVADGAVATLIVRGAITEADTPWPDAHGPGHVALAVADHQVARHLIGGGAAVHVVDVPLLNRDETVSIIGSLLGVPPSARLTDEVWRLSGGCLSLVETLIALARKRGAIHVGAHAAVLSAPLPVEGMLARQHGLVAHLSQQERQSFGLLALMDPAPISLAESLLDADHLRGFLERGLVRSLPAHGDRPPMAWIPFQALVAGLRDEPTGLLRGKLDDALLSPIAPDAEEAISFLGRWRAVLRRVEAHRPVRRNHILGAARAALMTHDYPEAIRLSSALVHGRDVDAATLAHALRARAFARRFAGDPQGAIEDLEQIVDPGRSPSEVAADLARLADLEHYERDDTDRAFALLDGAQNPAADPRILAAERIAHYAYDGQFTQSDREYRALPSMPFEMRARAAVAHAYVDCYRGRPLAGLQRLNRYATRQGFHPQPWLIEEMHAAIFTCLCHAYGPAYVGEINGFLGPATAQPFVRACDMSMLGARASLLSQHGRMAEVLALTRSIETGDYNDPNGVGPRLLAFGAEAAAYVGDETAARALIAAVEQAPRRGGAFMWSDLETSLLGAAAVLGDDDALSRSHTRAREHMADGLWGAAARLAHVGLRFGDPISAELIEQCRSHVEGEIHQSLLDQARAILADDPFAFRTGGDRCLEMGCALIAVEHFALAARAAERRGHTDLAEASWRRARLSAGALGTIQAAHLAGITVEPPALTRREQQIADLVAHGVSNRDIAQALTLSVRTVENHLNRVYTKWGISSRRELFASARQEPRVSHTTGR